MVMVFTRWSRFQLTSLIGFCAQGLESILVLCFIYVLFAPTVGSMICLIFSSEVDRV